MKTHFRPTFLGLAGRLEGVASLLGMLALGLIVTPAQSYAATVTWTGATGSDWNTVSNWSTTTTKPATADTALFNTTLGSVANATADQTVTSISFDTNAGTASGTFTLGTTGGNKITLSNSGTIQILSTLSGTGKTITVNSPIVLTPASGTTAGGYTFSNNNVDSTNTLNFGGTISSGTTTNTETLTLSGANTGNNTISGAITNGLATTFALTKSGAGKWILTGANNYTGATNLNLGTLQFSGVSGANSGASTYTLYGGPLIIDNTSAAGGNNNSRIADTSAIGLQGGIFIYNGTDTASTNSTETVGAITQGQNSSVISVTYGGTNLATLTAASFAHTSGYAMTLVNGTNLGKNNTDTGSLRLAASISTSLKVLLYVVSDCWSVIISVQLRYFSESCSAVQTA